MPNKKDKSLRLLHIYELLQNNIEFKTDTLSNLFGVSKKTISRDISHLKKHFDEPNSPEIKYNRAKDTYYLKSSDDVGLTKKERLAIIKILFESRAFCKNEMDNLLNKLLNQVSSHERKLIENIVNSEKLNYKQLCHNKNLENNEKMFDILWELSNQKKIITIEYIKQNGLKKTHHVIPVHTMFSEYYFYFIGFVVKENETGGIDKKDFPTVFRIDRIDSFKLSSIKFKNIDNEKIPYKGEIFFMYSGTLKKVSFTYEGPSIEAVLDKLPLAEYSKLPEKPNYYKISVEVYGEDGINMWLRSQGDYVDNISCEDLKQ